MTKQVLFIVERGGYVLPIEALVARGYRVEVETSMRKALTRLKNDLPDVIVAEFNFGPRYGDRISNLEPLLARLQAVTRPVKTVVLAEREYRHHVETLRARFAIAAVLVFPIDGGALTEAIARAVPA